MTNATLTPNADLRTLDSLVGTWRLSGDTSGTVTYEWMHGGFFLVQHIDMELFGDAVKGIEVIGHLRPFNEEAGARSGRVSTTTWATRWITCTSSTQAR